jgi:hypothetical protein
MTDFRLLSESHLRVHTFPEWGVGARSLSHGRAECRWPWGVEPAERLGAEQGSIRTIHRGEVAGATCERLHAAPAAPTPT